MKYLLLFLCPSVFIIAPNGRLLEEGGGKGGVGRCSLLPAVEQVRLLSDENNTRGTQTTLCRSRTCCTEINFTPFLIGRCDFLSVSFPFLCGSIGFESPGFPVSNMHRLRLELGRDTDYLKAWMNVCLSQQSGSREHSGDLVNLVYLSHGYVSHNQRVNYH